MANIGNININNSNNNVTLQSPKSIYCESFYFEDFYDEKALRKFINSIKAMIRKSREYNDYISALPKVALGLSRDNILSNIRAGDATLNFHHYPFELDEIVEIVINHNVLHGIKQTTFSVTKEILSLHYENIIGLTPLVTTNHELQHLGKLILKRDQIFGDFDTFIDRYKDGISNDQFITLEKINKLTKNDAPSDYLNLFETK